MIEDKNILRLVAKESTTVDKLRYFFHTVGTYFKNMK